MALNLKDAATKMKANRDKQYFFFYCEADQNGKTHLSFDEKKVPNGSEVLSKAQKKVKCVGEMAVNGDGELVITPHGSVPSNIGTKVKIALKEESVQGINGVTINKAKPESEETSPPGSGE